MHLEKIKDSISKNRITKLAVQFVACMIACALIARGIYAYRLPRITVANVEKRTISHNVLMEGMAEAVSEVAVYTIPDLRVDQICVKEGQTVKKGDKLFSLNMTELEKCIEKKKAEENSLILQIQNLKMNQDMKQKAYLEKQQRAKEDYETIVKNGEQEISDAAQKLLDAQQELQQFATKDAYIEHKKSADSQLASYKSARDVAKDKKYSLEDKVDKLEGKIKDEKKALNALDTDNELSEEEKRSKREEIEQRIKELQKEFEQQDEELKEQKDSYEEAKENLSNYEKSLEISLADEWNDKQESLQKDIDEKTRSYQSTITAKENEVTIADRGVEDASQPEIVDSLLQQNEIALNTMQNDIAQYQQIYNDGGIFYSQIDGMVQKVVVEPGGMTPAGAAVILSPGQEYYDFVATFSKKDKQYVNIGDRAVLSLEKGRIMIEDIEIYAITQGTEKETYQAYAQIPANQITWHQSGVLQITKQSQTYDTCVPLQALVANGTQYECRVLKEQNGFMGLEYAVEMRPVKVLDHNQSFAAIEPLTVSEEEKVITESNKVLQSGDIVRLKDL